MKIILTILLLSPLSLFAQSPYPNNMMNMNPNDMNKMMQQMQSMETCIDNIDMSSLELIEKEYHDIRVRIDSMCKAGNRAKAKQTAIDFAQSVNNNTELNKMKKCMGPMMQRTPADAINDQLANENSHICDQ